VRPFVAHALGDGRPVGLVDFCRKRFARIWPAYLVALLGSLAIGVGTIDGLDGWLKHGFLVDSWYDDGGGTGLRVSWTLVVEVAFYAAVLPVGYLVLAARGRRLDAWIAVCLLTLGYGSWALWLTTQEHTEPWLRVLPPYLPGFALGMLLAVAEASDGRGAWLGPVLRGVRALAGRPWICWGIAAALAVGMITLMGPSESAPAFLLGRDRAVQSFLQVAIGALALAPLALRSTAAAPLTSGPLTVMAGVSFGFFLWHIQALRLVRPLLDGGTVLAAAGLALAFGGSLLAGELSRRFVEAPARRLLVGR
jgi:peptidoglycan/LPS O-acetylase OafA/YrhL